MTGRDTWTAERARHARQAAVRAWEEITAAGGAPAERARAWAAAERALSREADLSGQPPEPEPQS